MYEAKSKARGIHPHVVPQVPSSLPSPLHLSEPFCVCFFIWYWGFPMVLSGRVRNSVYFPFSWKQKSYVLFLKVSLRRKKCFKERVSSSSWGFQCERPWNSCSGGPPGKQTSAVCSASKRCHPSVAVQVLRHSCTWKTREIEHSILRWLGKVPLAEGVPARALILGEEALTALSLVQRRCIVAGFHWWQPGACPPPGILPVHFLAVDITIFHVISKKCGECALCV